MNDTKKKLCRFKELAFSACLQTFKISFCLEFWNQDKSLCMGQLPLSISSDWQLASCGTCIRIDSSEGQIIVLVGEAFIIEGVRYSVKRKIQLRRNSCGSLLVTPALLCRRTVFGLGCAALIAILFSPNLMKKLWGIQNAPMDYETSEQTASQINLGRLESTADPKGTETHASTSAASYAAKIDSSFTAGDVSPENFKRTKSEKKKMTDRGRPNKEKIDPIRCAPIRRVSQSKILERFQGTEHNRRNWYVCR